MVLYNYTSLKSHDTKIYSVAGTQVSSMGISVAWLKVVGSGFAVGTLIGILIAVVTRINFYNPVGDHFSLWYIALTSGGGLGIGCALWYIKIETYRLIEYLIAYFKPKKTYHNLNTRNKEFKLYKLTTKGIIQQDL